MAESLGSILQGKDLNEPEEIRIIKNFVMEKFRSNAQITIQPRQIIIGVSNASLAGTLRLHLHELAKTCQTDKKLVIRIESA